MNVYLRLGVERLKGESMRDLIDWLREMATELEQDETKVDVSRSAVQVKENKQAILF